jgi:ribosomal protein S18 acetylase RimI-like enzyme
MEDRAIRRGLETDATNLVATLAAAFQDDPAFRWIVPDDAARARKLTRFFRMAVAEDLLAGRILTSPQAEVATLWRSPGRHKQMPLGNFQSNLSFLRIFGFSLPRGMRVGETMARNHPNMPHWYLRYVAVLPGAQGKGWGGLALRSGIAMADADSIPIYLETAKETNVGLYQRFGFEVISEWDVPDGGPHFWSMLRG